jgi:hypothetical protein
VKKIFTISALLFFCSCTKSQSYFNHLVKNGVQHNAVSSLKNIQPVSTDSLYEAFGFLDTIRVNKLSYYVRGGTDHLTAGAAYYRDYNISANHWYDRVQFATNAKDARDVYGTWMHDAGSIDSTMMFLQWSNNGAAGDWSIDLQIIKCDSLHNFGSPVNFDWSGVAVRLQRGFVFGHVVKGDNAGEYYEPLVQFNVDTGSTRYRISVLKTTDRWAHYSEVGVIFDGSTSYNETALANLGGGKFLALKRNGVSGVLTPSESTNSCAAWTARVASNLYWYIGAEAEMADINVHDGVFDITYQCRDADMLHISKGNTVGSNFGLSTPTYNDAEIYSHHLGTGSNPSLGYPTKRKLPDGNYIIVYGKEYNNHRANLQWTIDDLVTDPAGAPVAPPGISTSFITSAAFRYDMTGYTDKQIENIRYWQQDLSTDPAFGSFVTAEYRIHSGAYPAVSIHNIRVLGLWDKFATLTTGTTYYLRIRACNNTGCSAYTTINVTTL